MTAPIDFLEVPASALCGEVMALTCKGPDEERSYVVEYGQQLDPDDYIASSGFAWVAGDSSLTVTDIQSYGKRFRFTLNGGTLNQKSGLTITIPLVSGDIRTLTLTVTIEEQGVLQSGTVPVIMGSQGPRGTIIWPYDSDKLPPNNWSPSSTIAVKTGDFVLISETHQLYEITVDNQGYLSYQLFVDLGASSELNSSTVIKTEDNTTTIGNLVDNQATSKKVTDFFYVTTSGYLAIDSTKIPVSDPAEADALWLNGDFLTRSNG